MKNAYLICPVTNATPELQAEIDAFVAKKKAEGWNIHNPKYDAPQNDPTGVGIYEAHLEAFLQAERVFIFWDSQSTGSLVDIGMLIRSGLEVEIVRELRPDKEGKSFTKILRDLQQNGPLVIDGRVARPDATGNRRRKAHDPK